MKALYTLLLFLLWAAPLSAQQVPVLTELEQIQEKIWFLQRDVSTLQDAFREDQQQLMQLADELRQEDRQAEKQLTELTEANTAQRQAIAEVEAALDNLAESLTTLTAEVQQQNAALLDHAERIDVLEDSLQGLQGEMATGKTAAGQDLTELKTEVAAVRGHLGENRTRVSELEQELGNQVKRLTLYGVGVALALVFLMAIGFAVLKSRESPI